MAVTLHAAQKAPASEGSRYKNKTGSGFTYAK
jgi:hypothetical protein